MGLGSSKKKDQKALTQGPTAPTPDPTARGPSPKTEELSGIADIVRRAIGSEYLSLQGSSVLGMVSCLATKYESLRRQNFEDRDTLGQEKLRLEGLIQVNQKKAQSQEAEWRNRENQYITRIDDLRRECELQTRLRKEYEERIGAMEKRHTDHVAGLRARYRDEEQRMGEKHKFTVQDLEGTIRSLKTHGEEREKYFIFEKAQLDESHRTKQDKLKEQFEAQESKLKEQFEAHESKLKEQFEARESKLKARESKLKEQFEIRESKLKEQFEAHESKLKQAHNQQQERLQKDIQSRNKALIARETISSITDGELKSVFSDLVREVDALARLKWTLNRSPWTDELQSQISDAPRRLQKWVLQDTIWNALFENVFCTPFRVFGKEGGLLESQWNKAFGEDTKTDNGHYIWPEPSFDAERWRYETMRQCQEALKIPTSEYDPRTKLRNGFQSSMKIIREKLGEALEMVSKVDEKTEQTIEKVTEKAAKMWVAFGTQRCRLLVVIQDLKTTEEVKKGPDKQDRSVELITQPELRRIGDAEGELLGKEQTVAGCEGEIKKILYSCQ